jgi:hypothetical protein
MRPRHPADDRERLAKRNPGCRRRSLSSVPRPSGGRPRTTESGDPGRRPRPTAQSQVPTGQRSTDRYSHSAARRGPQQPRGQRACFPRKLGHVRRRKATGAASASGRRAIKGAAGHSRPPGRRTGSLAWTWGPLFAAALRPALALLVLARSGCLSITAPPSALVALGSSGIANADDPKSPKRKAHCAPTRR